MGSKIFSSIIRLTLLAILFLFVFFPDKLHLKIDYPFVGLIDNFYVRLAKTVLLLLIMIEIVRIFYYGIIKNTKISKSITNISTLALMVILLVIGLEIVFMYVAQSHEGALSKASQIWFARYWKPVTPEGYRENPKTHVENKQKVLVIGDSFAAGHGIKNTEDRFSDRLEQLLGQDKYAVYNLGISGSDSRDEFLRLSKYPIKPKILVLEYFPNDIEKAAKDAKLTLGQFQPYEDITAPGVGSLVMRFYLPNYIYWQFPHVPPASITDFVQKSYSDTTILNPHLRDLQKFIDYSKQYNAKLYVVMIPFLQNIEKSNGYTKPIEDFFVKNNIPIVRLSDYLPGIPASERIVGKNDGHASAKVNALIADKLYEKIKKDL